MTLRLLQRYGMRASLRVYWGDDCPNSYGKGGVGTHNGQFPILDVAGSDDWTIGGEPVIYGPECWPPACDHCGTWRPSLEETAPCGRTGCEVMHLVVSRQVFREELFRADDGELLGYRAARPGDAYYLACNSSDAGKCYIWDNCPGEHLHVVLPDGRQWDTGSRANNCTMPNDRMHRCWCVHGDPRKGELVTVDKNGHTCRAGAGSIDTGTWHGFLRSSNLVRC